MGNEKGRRLLAPVRMRFQQTLREFVSGERPFVVGSIFLFAGTVGLLTWFVVAFLSQLAEDSPRDVQVFIGEVSLFLAVFCGTILMALIERRKAWSYGLADARAVQRLLSGAFCGIVLVSLLIACLIALGNVEIKGRLLYGREIFTYGAAWGLLFAVAAFAEEMLFRGYLQVTLARTIGFWPAAALLSLVFGLVHLMNAHETTFAIITTILIGVVLCLCLQLSGSLWWGIGFHASWNWAQAFLYGAPASGYRIHDSLLLSRAVGPSFWNGGNAGPESSVLALPIIAIAAVVVILTFRRRRADL